MSALTIASLPWRSTHLRNLYPAHANGNTYLCRAGTGETQGVVFGNGSGYWGRYPRERPIRGPRQWRKSAPAAGFRIVVSYDRSAGWVWVVSPQPRTSRRAAARGSR